MSDHFKWRVLLWKETAKGIKIASAGISEYEIHIHKTSQKEVQKLIE